MTQNKSTWTVTIDRKNEKSNSLPHEAVSAEAAVKLAADNLGVTTDAEGNVSGDDQISRITAVAAEQPKLHHQ